jgi:hypothetical protein
MKAHTGLIWLRIATGDGYFSVFVFHILRGIS